MKQKQGNDGRQKWRRHDRMEEYRIVRREDNLSIFWCFFSVGKAPIVNFVFSFNERGKSTFSRIHNIIRN